MRTCATAQIGLCSIRLHGLTTAQPPSKNALSCQRAGISFSKGRKLEKERKRNPGGPAEKCAQTARRHGQDTRTTSLWLQALLIAFFLESTLASRTHQDLFSAARAPPGKPDTHTRKIAGGHGGRRTMYRTRQDSQVPIGGTPHTAPPYTAARASARRTQPTRKGLRTMSWCGHSGVRRARGTAHRWSARSVRGFRPMPAWPGGACHRPQNDCSLPREYSPAKPCSRPPCERPSSKRTQRSRGENHFPSLGNQCPYTKHGQELFD